jgi:hypothetical protein
MQQWRSSGATDGHSNAANSDTRLNAALRRKKKVSRQAQEDEAEEVMDSRASRLFIARLLRE